MQIKKPETFEELLELQRILDENTTKTRENGFTPRERNIDDIKLSLIAELIEFDEELPQTHKTWKQKNFNKENAIIESVDVLFFFLQFVNHLKDIRAKSINRVIKNCDFNKIKFFSDNKEFYSMEFDSFSIICIIYDLLNGTINNFFFRLCRMYSSLELTKEDVFNAYFEKWQKNMERINKDWTLKGEQNGNVQCK